MAASLDVLVLGPVVVRTAEGTTPVERPLERALLTRLALARGTPVPDERLAADLWGDAELARPAERLRVLASRLRNALGDSAPALSRSPGGYALAAQPADLIAARATAERLHAAARAGDHARVRTAAREALDLWRGPALADLRTIPFAAAEADRLDAWRLDLLVERLDADLALGAAGEVGGELERLAAEHPLHERLCRLLALALYRNGRQADALGRLAGLRHALADELGVDPSPETAAMELDLLRQDPALLPPPSPATPIPVETLPVPASGFVGRDGSLAALLERLVRPGLVTLIGEPGSGKSRLAVETARAITATGRTVTLAELAPLHHAGAVVGAVAAAAGVETAEADPVPAFAAALDGTLLVLDNAEHLVEPVAGLCTSLLRRTPGLTVLVTSQRPLLVAGEELHRVGPLEPAAAVRLFELRCAADARTDPRSSDAICAAVDRLPLGIELAAGLTRTLTVPQLARRVNDRLRLLVGGARDSGARHTSLRAALDWSHDLLGDQERTVLRRVAVFAGGFELETAEQVTSGSELEAGDLAPALIDLVDRSLVTVDASGGRRRFGLLETVRDYALAKLAAAGEAETTRTRHLAWCLAHVREAPGDGDFQSAEQVAEVFREWPNLLEALERAPGTERAADGLRLALELHTPWLIRGWFDEARRHFGALARAPGIEPGERALALSDHGFVSTMTGRFDEAAELLTSAAELLPLVDDDMVAMTVLYHRGIVEIERGHLGEARTALLAGEDLARKAGHEQRISAFADALGTLLLYAGEPEAALDRYSAAVARDREAGDEHGLARGLSNQAQAMLALGRTADAISLATESDHFARRLDDRQILPLNDLIRGCAAQADGDLAEAETHLRSATASGPGMAHIDLADVLIAGGRLDEAAELLEAVYAETVEQSIPWLAARTVSAALALASGNHRQARELAEATAADHATSGFGWQRYTDRLTEIRHRLAE